MPECRLGGVKVRLQVSLAEDELVEFGDATL